MSTNYQKGDLLLCIDANYTSFGVGGPLFVGHLYEVTYVYSAGPVGVFDGVRWHGPWDPARFRKVGTV